MITHNYIPNHFYISHSCYSLPQIYRVVSLKENIVEFECVTGEKGKRFSHTAEAMSGTIYPFTREKYEMFRRKYTESLACLEEGMAAMHHNTRFSY